MQKQEANTLNFWHGTFSADNATYNQLVDTEDMEDLVDDIEDPANVDGIELVKGLILRLPTKDASTRAILYKICLQ